MRTSPLAAMRRRTSRVWGAFLGFVFLAVTAAMPAVAGVGGAVGPTWPTPVKVGQSFSGAIDIQNASNGSNASETVDVMGIFFTPSCAAGQFGVCAIADPGVFQISAPIGMPGTACGGVRFTVGTPDPSTGEVAFLPDSTVKLGPADRSGGASNPPFCRIVINATVLKMPQDSTPLDLPVTTRQFARASLLSEVSKVSGNALGEGTVTVTAAAVNLNAAPGNSQVALSWSGASMYKLVFSTGSSPASCNVGTALLSGAASSFTHAGLINGSTYYYRLCTLDAQGNLSPGITAGATPQAANQPPVANAGPNQFTQTLTTISFNGSGSYDPDGSIVSYAWIFGDGGSDSGVIVSHAYTAAGTYTATLTVRDNSGATASASATVNVANRPPLANAGPDQSTTVGTTVTFNGSSSSDPDGSIISYNWNFGDGFTLSSGNVPSASHAYADPGVFTTTLTVTDNSGAQASDTALITVTNPSTAAGSYRWATRFGGAGSTAASYSTAVDGSGNVIVAGAFWGTVDFGGGPLTSSGSSDIFVAKYSPAGAHIWSKKFGDSLDDVAHAVTVDVSGNVIVVGSFKGTINFGGGPLTAYYSGFGAKTRDLFVAKYSPTGAHLWSKSAGSFGDDIAYGAAVDAGGNVLVVGSFVGMVDFGGTTLASAADSADIFLVKYSSTGQLVWAKGFGGDGIDTGYGVAVDAGGNIFLTGTFTGPADFGGGPLAGAGSGDIVLAKYSPTGQHLWSKQFGNVGADVGYAVAADSAGNVVLTGYVQNTVDFGGGPTPSLGSLDTFIAKYSADGAHLWSRRFGGTNADEGFGIATDTSGNIFLVGTFQGTADFGSGLLTSSGGSWDIVAAKYSATGTPLWSKRFGSTGDDLGYSVAVDRGGNATFTGTFHGTVDFGGGALTSAGWTDMFILDLAP